MVKKVKEWGASMEGSSHCNEQITIRFTEENESVILEEGEKPCVDLLPQYVWLILKEWIDSRSDYIKPITSVRLNSVDGASGGLAMGEIEYQ